MMNFLTRFVDDVVYSDLAVKTSKLIFTDINMEKTKNKRIHFSKLIGICNKCIPLFDDYIDFNAKEIGRISELDIPLYEMNNEKINAERLMFDRLNAKYWNLPDRNIHTMTLPWPFDTDENIKILNRIYMNGYKLDEVKRWRLLYSAHVNGCECYLCQNFDELQCLQHMIYDHCV